MNKHTKSPWDYEGDTLTHRHFNIYAAFGGNLGQHTHICTVNNLPHHLLIARDPQEAEANARLIAAAPEMLEALKLTQQLMKNFMQKGNINWGQTCGIDFGLMNETLIKVDKTLIKVDKTLIKAEGVKP